MSEKKKNVLSGLLLVLSSAFIYIGVERGEVITVIQKAVMVCLECIGIG